MTNMMKRRALLAATTILCSGLAAPAFAQSVYQNIDGNGVDLTDGSYNLAVKEGSIGAGQSELSMMRYHGVDGFQDNWQSIILKQSVSGSVTSVVISFGRRSESFSGTNTNLVSRQGEGATLQKSGDDSYMYRNADGTIIRFTSQGVNPGGQSNLCTATSNPICTMLASSIETPDGRVTNFTWDIAADCVGDRGNQDCTYSWRLSEVRNNSGYVMDIIFQTNTPGSGDEPVPGWSRRSSIEFSNLNAALPSPHRIQYAYPAANVTEVTSPGNLVWRFTANDLRRAIGVKRPAAATDSTIIAYTGNQVSSITVDGVTTNYNYTVSGTTATMVRTDQLARQTVTVSDMSKYRPTSFTDARGKITGFTYDATNRPLQITAPEGNKTIYAYDARGNVTAATARDKAGTVAADIVTRANYPTTCTSPASCNKPVWTQDAKTSQTDYLYNDLTGLPTQRPDRDADRCREQPHDL